MNCKNFYSPKQSSRVHIDVNYRIHNLVDNICAYWHNGVVVRAFAAQSVDLELIFKSSHTKRL